jgi:hypothetical protein
VGQLSWDDVFWTAGFYEGEGSLGPYAVLAHQVNRWPLDRLADTLGGTVGSRPRRNNRPNQRPCWHWSVGGEQARNMIKLIYPYLSPRRQDQIDKIFITEEKLQRRRLSISPAPYLAATLDDELKNNELAERRFAIMWAAGFYEGEGCIAPRHTVISQVNKWPLDWLVTNFGGNIQKQRAGNGNRSPIWQWAICGDSGRLFIELIYPHLSPERQRQIDCKFLTEEKLATNKVAFKKHAAERMKRRWEEEPHTMKCIKLTKQDVIEIRESKEKLLFLSKRYGVSQAAISLARNRKTWVNV